MKVLLVYPKFPVAYWSFHYTLALIGKKALLPPLGLITVAALCPREWTFRLVDANVDELRDRDLRWADVVFVGGMLVQHDGMMETLRRCKALGVRTVVGGPHATSSPELFGIADHLVLDEAETTLSPFLADLQQGTARRTYRSDSRKPDVHATPVPRFDLLRLDAYANMCVQYSRGCPFDCEFCDIIELYGRKPRPKRPEQLVGELEALRLAGWRGRVFVVDDNFIGNRTAVRQLLPHVEEWQRHHRYPMSLYTEASMNVAVDQPLMAGMLAAGFTGIFVGIETPSVTSLKHTKKVQNTIGDPLAQVWTIQRAGLEVMGGFIIGFDTDDESIFEAQQEYIRQARIPFAMIGILNALPNTQLWRRLHAEGRLLSRSTGDPLGSTNFVTRIPADLLLDGYRRVLASLYDPDAFFDRIYDLLEALAAPGVPRWMPFQPPPLYKRFRTALAFGWLLYLSRYRKPARRLVRRLRTSLPSSVPLAASRMLLGYHFLEYTRRDLLPALSMARKSLAAASPLPPSVVPEHELISLHTRR